MCKALISAFITVFIFYSAPFNLNACSTFKFQKGGELIYAHNLDQPERDMPGTIFINKRGVFKTGRSFSEMFFDKDRKRPSDLCWISRYGSITFSIYGRDFPDGGINEAGIFIWEMGMVGTEYPVSEELPKLLKMNWMQYILDNFGTLDDALTAAYDIEVEGWQWHFFLGDAQGNCATIEFIDGEAVIHRGENMPIPALFNRPYDQEIRYLHYFKGFGGLYEPDMNDEKIPRMVKAAVMLRDYDPAVNDPLDYSKALLYEVGNKPYKWGILIDVVRRNIYFNTEANQEWKSFSFMDIDYSNDGPFMTLNIDQPVGGDVSALFHPLNDDEFGATFKGYVDDLPPSSFEYYGIPGDTMIARFSKAYHRAEKKENQYFSGIWKGLRTEADDDGNKEQLTLEFKTDGSNVSGSINFRGDDYQLEHIHLNDKNLDFTFRSKNGTFIFPQGRIYGSSLELRVYYTWGVMGDYLLQKQ